MQPPQSHTIFTALATKMQETVNIFAEKYIGFYRFQRGKRLKTNTKTAAKSVKEEQSVFGNAI